MRQGNTNHFLILHIVVSMVASLINGHHISMLMALVRIDLAVEVGS